MFVDSPYASRYSLVFEEKTGAFGPEADFISDSLTEEYRYLSSTISSESLIQKFDRLAATWKQDTVFQSSFSKIATNTAYLEIIGMGKNVLPLIFFDLGRDKSS